MLKKISLLIVTGLLLSACSAKTKVKTPLERQVRQLINALPVAKRPFLIVLPHPTAKLLSLYLDRVGDSYKQSTIDLEYLSGNALKGGRTTIDLPKPMPYSQAFLLGSCSSGGRCSFDPDLISGNIKNKLDDGSETLNVLKSDFVFVNKGEVTSTDGRVTYTPTNTKQKDQIMMDTQGLPKDVDGQLAYNPIAISAVNGSKISGKLNFRVGGVSKVMIYDGTNFQPLKAVISEDSVTVDLSHNPWNKAVTIIRDDLKGAVETTQLYLLGPILLLK